MAITIPDIRVTRVKIQRDTFTVALMDGRSISVPIAWYPRLLHATHAQLQQWEVCGGGYGIHWPLIDEHLNTEWLLRDAPAP